MDRKEEEVNGVEGLDPGEPASVSWPLMDSSTGPWGP